jgi:hypothetical protein
MATKNTDVWFNMYFWVAGYTPSNGETLMTVSLSNNALQSKTFQIATFPLCHIDFRSYRRSASLIDEGGIETYSLELILPMTICSFPAGRRIHKPPNVHSADRQES